MTTPKRSRELSALDAKIALLEERMKKGRGQSRHLAHYRKLRDMLELLPTWMTPWQIKQLQRALKQRAKADAVHDAMISPAKEPKRRITTFVLQQKFAELNALAQSLNGK